MSDNQNDQRNAPEKRKLSMTLGLGFALGVAAFGISDAFLSDNESGCRQENKSNNPPNYMLYASSDPSAGDGALPPVWHGNDHC